MQNNRLLFLPFAFLLLLSTFGAGNLHGGEFTATNLNNSAGNTLTDVEITTMLRDYIDTDKQGVGLVVGVVDEHGPRVVHYGKLDNGTDADVDGDTLFEIGSITKVFTTLLLQDMVERGEMRLDDPVQNYLPDSVKMPTYQGKQITLLHLATHTSSLPREVNNLTPESWRNPGAGYTIGQLYDFLSRCRLQRAPGTRQEYSNLGVALLGYVIALKAGKDYETLVQERICRPLGMDSTCITVLPKLKMHLAVGHAMPGASTPCEDFSVSPGAGGLRSSANDLLKFVSACLGLTQTPLSSLMQKAESRHRVESGAELRLGWWGDGTVFEHNGRTLGYVANLAFDAKTRRGVVVLANCMSSGIVFRIWPPLLEERSLKPTKAVPVDAATCDRFVGQYQNDQRAICTVRREGDRLMFQWIGRPGQRARYPSYEMFPTSESAFRNEFWRKQATFDYTDVDSPIKMKAGFPTVQTEMTRISMDVPKAPAPVRLDPGIYDRYVGRYRMPFFFGLIHLGPTFNVRHETDEFGNHLVGYITGKKVEKYIPGLAGDLLGAEIFPVNETTFFTPLDPDGLQITFLRNKKGKTTSAMLELRGSKIRAAQISKHPAPN
jgi:serine-type D-Ala-D-Ala carboxypeptidase/endopeptidase